MTYHGTEYNGGDVNGIAINGNAVNGLIRDGQVTFEDASDGYVHNGLVARYIASRNARTGYDPSALIWRDVVGHADLQITPASLDASRKWGANYFASQKADATWYTMQAKLPESLNPEDCTVEFVMMYTEPADTTNGGDIWSFNARDTAPYATADNEVYGSSLRFYAPETASYSQVGAQGLTANKMYGVSTQIQPYNDGAGRKQMYLNGVRKVDVARAASQLYIRKSPVDLALLGNPAFQQPAQLFFGKLYELRIYGRALTPEEIAQNYARDAAVYGIV